MKKRYFFMSLVWYAFSNFAHEQPPQEPTTFYKIINDNSQKIVQKTKPNTCCQDVANVHLRECFFSLPVAEQREIFKQFPPAKRRECLRQLDYKDFEKFLKAYSEHEWKELYESLTEHERSHWPKTVKEQWIEVQKIQDTADMIGQTLHGISVIGGHTINPLFYGISAYMLIQEAHDGINPVKYAYINDTFIRYMEKTYEL